MGSCFLNKVAKSLPIVVKFAALLCPPHSGPMPGAVRERFDSSCWKAGSDMASRDASCQGNLVCAKKGYDNRDFGDCPGQHCCSMKVSRGPRQRPR